MLLRGIHTPPIPPGAIAAAALGLVLTVSAAPFSPGDVFVGTTGGTIQHFDRATGALVQTLDTLINDNIGGICFDSDWNLYATLFNNPNKLAVFEPAGGTLVTNAFLPSPPPAGLFYKAEGCTVSAHDEIYVGHVGSSTISPADVRRYHRDTGALEQVYSVALTPPPGNGNGPTFLDLGCDQCTMYYTESGQKLRRFDVCADVQLPDFVTAPPDQRFFDLRVRSDGSDEVLVADTGFLATSYSAVQQFDSGATTLHTYPDTTYFGGSHNKICVLDVDHVDDNSFWTTPGSSASVMKRIELTPPYATLDTVSISSSTALEVLNPHKCGCAEPPADMAAWWPFDEPTGTAAVDIAGGNDGTYGGVAGPTPDDGMVADSLRFGGVTSHVIVPDDASLDFPDFTFTVDFWIRPDLGEVGGTIVRKGLPNGPDPFQLAGPGYHIFYHLGHFFVFFRGPSFGYQNDISDNFLYHADPEEWTHVAITVGPGVVSPGYTYKIELWIDGFLAKVTPMPNVGDPSNAESLVIGGSDFIGATTLHGFDGRLDELELFPRRLTPSEIDSVYLAGTAGKCKDEVHPPWDKAICVDDQNQQESVIVDIEICNYQPTTSSYELSFKTLPIGSSGIGGGCNVVGPPSFDDPASPGTYYPPPKPITVAGGTCQIEQVKLEKPVAFTDASAVGKVGCYETRLLNLDTGHVKRMNGSVQATAGPCPVVMSPVDDATEVFVLVPGAPRPIVIELLDSFDERRPMPVTIEPFDSDMSGESAPLSINGAQPGEAFKDTVILPGARAKAKANITLVVESTSREPFGFQDVLVLADLDRETCGLEPLISIGFRSPMLSEIDLDEDGLTNDFEVTAGLSPYKPNQVQDLVKLYALVLSDTVQCLKIFLEERLDLIDRAVFELVEDAIKFVQKGSVDLEEGDRYNALSVVQSAVETLEKADSSSTGPLLVQVQPHIITMTAATGVFVDGLVQFMNKEGRDVTKARGLIEQGRDFEQVGKYKRAVARYRRAFRSADNNKLF